MSGYYPEQRPHHSHRPSYDHRDSYQSQQQQQPPPLPQGQYPPPAPIGPHSPQAQAQAPYPPPPGPYGSDPYYNQGGPPPEAGRRHGGYGGSPRRGYDSDSTEEIERDYPPHGAYVKRKSSKRDRDRHGGGGGGNYRSSSVGRDEYRGQGSGRRNRRRRDSYSSSSSRSPPRRSERDRGGGRRQSLGDAALAALGLGGAAAASGRDRRSHGRYDDYHRGGRGRSHSRSSRRREYSYSRSRSRSIDASKRWQQAIKAAGTAAALEAWKSRKEPGGFSGKGRRIVTAAIGAAGVDGAMDRHPDAHGTRHVLQSAVGGLVGNRLINGSRSRSRSRGRDGSGPGLGGLASAAGLAGLAAKGLQNYRSKSRGDRGGGGRRGSYSSYSSGSPPPRNKRSRSKSISRYLERGISSGMAKLGLSENEKGKSGRRRHYSDDDLYSGRPRRGEMDIRGGGAPARVREKASRKYHGSSTDSYSSSEEERKQRKMRGKEYLTAGLATVATIHAAHSVYQSVEKRKQRHRKVLEGQISPEQAKKQRNRARLQEAASVGIAALGIKGAVSEWKEMKEQNHEMREHKHRWEEKHAHRRAKMIEAAKSRASAPDLRDKYRSDSEEGPYDARAESVPRPPMGG